MTEYFLFEMCGFTAAGRCFIVQELSGDRFLVQLENKSTRLILHHEDVRDVNEEICRRQLIARTDVITEALALKNAIAAGQFQEGHFPDMRSFDLPNVIRITNRLPKSLRDLQEKGVYRPQDLPPLFEQHLRQVASRVRRCARWAECVHSRALPLIIGALEGSQTVPENIRFMDTRKRVSTASQAGGFMGYVDFPAPADLNIIPLNFFWPNTSEARRKKVHLVKGEPWIEIGNARLLIGLSLWPGVKFHDIHFLTKDENIEESMQDDLFS